LEIVMMLPRLIACLGFAIPLLALAADDDHTPVPGDADVTLDNHWGIPLDLYVDRKFGCSAPNYGTCTVRVDAGEHELQARDGDEMVAREFVTLKPGENFSYHVEKGKSPNL
jgi:hypothetical protein